MISRPAYHFTPPQNFMNDPNGLLYFDGEYHMFYQHNPFGIAWGHMSWGHAVSRDLLHWEHLPVALAEEDGIMMFSGSAVVDWHNTSGFGVDGGPPLIAIYTGHSPNEQTQNLAYSTDRGRTWTKYHANPVVAIGSHQFRDPKVLWHSESNQWIMVTVLADQHKVSFYGSRDLKHWSHLSDFGPAGQVDNEWECPDLFEINVENQAGAKKWVLKVDVNHSILGQYFIGHFDGARFTNDNPVEHVLRLDYGRDFYAAQSWSDMPDSRRVWIGWMNNWGYANSIPASSWRGMFSIPREIRLEEFSNGLRLAQSPIEELKQLRQLVCHIDHADVATVNLQLAGQQPGIAQEVLVKFGLGSARKFGIKVRAGGTEQTVVGYSVLGREMFVDRTRSGDFSFSEKFAGIQRAPLEAEHGSIKLHIYVDASSVEVFGNDGQAIISSLIFPDDRSVGMELFSLDGDVQIDSLDIWELA